MTRLSSLAVIVALLAIAPAVFSQTLTWPFCYSFTGGIGDGSRDGKLYSIVASGSLTTSATGVNVTTSAGVQTAYTITGINGSRTYIDEAGQSFQNTFLTVTSGVFYSTYPFFDTTGISILTDSFIWNYDGNSTAKNLTIFIDSADMFDETIINSRTGAISSEVVGNVDVRQNATLLQCAFNAGPKNVYNFCYSLVPSTSSSAEQWNILTYGQFVGTGPVLRKGQQVITMQSMTGVRKFSNQTFSQSTPILHLVYVNGDEIETGGAILNDNLVFVRATELDYYGYSYTTLMAPVFPGGAYYPTIFDINLSASNEFKFYEWPVSADLDANYGASTNSTANYFNYNLASTQTFPCASSVTIPPMVNYYFCYLIQTNDYTIRASGSVTVFGSPIVLNGTTGYAIANITGTRAFTRGGQTSTSYFVGSSADSFGALNNTYSQLFYPTAPHIDNLGILIQISSNTNTALGTVLGSQVIDLQLSGGNVTENAWTTGGQFTSSTGTLRAATSASSLTCDNDRKPNGASQLSPAAFSIISIIFITIISMMML